MNSSASGTLILGAASAPATITLASGGVATFNAATSGATVAINDTIVDPSVGLGTVAFRGVSGGIIQVNSLNTYSGTTAFNGVTGSFVRFNNDFHAGDSSGPFGTGTLYFNNTNNNQLQPVGGDRTIANPLNLNFGFSVSSAPGEVHSLTFTGPIIFTSTGRTITNNLAAGAILTLGSSGSPSTITLPPSNSQGSSLSSSGTLVINDTIQDSPGVAANLNVTGNGTVILNGSSSSNGNMSVNSTNSTTNGLPYVAINGPRGGSGNFTFSAGTTGFAGTYKVTAQNTYSGTTTLSGLAANILVGTDSTMSGTPVTAGPFGTGTVIMNNGNGPPILQPIGADRTIGNVFTFSSGLFAATASAANDGTGAHNLTLSGPLNMTSGGKVITNNISSGASLIFGNAGSPSTLTISSGAMTAQTNTPGLGKNIIINDFVTGNGGITVKNTEAIYLTNANSYVGATTVTGDSDAAGYGFLYVNNTSGSGTGSSTVTARGNNTGAGKGGTIGGSGTISGTANISSSTAGQQGGNLSLGTNGLGSRGTLTVGAMNWSPGGRYIFEYNASDTTKGAGVNDLVRSTAGALGLGQLSSTATFDINLQPYDGTPSNTPVTYVLADFGGQITSPIGGNDLTSLFTFSGLFNGTPSVMIDSVNPDLLDITFAPVPEPTTLLFGALAAIGLGIRPRRRNRAT